MPKSNMMRFTFINWTISFGKVFSSKQALLVLALFCPFILGHQVLTLVFVVNLRDVS